MSLRGLARLVACASVAAAFACIDITVSGSDLGSLQFVPLAYPSVDEGDTLRDANGVLAPLVATAYRADGTFDPDFPVDFIALDSGVKIAAPAPFVIGDSLPAASAGREVDLIAESSGLQSLPRKLFVVRRPDTLFSATTSQNDSIRYSIPAGANDATGELKVTLSKKNGAALVGVRGYIVRYWLKKGNATLPSTDTSRAFYLTTPEGRVSTVDTTGAAGDAGRILRFRIRPGQAPTDTVEVLAEARRGGRMARDTIRWTVRVAPK